jgi:hypothetical protein
MDTMTIDGAYN